MDISVGVADNPPNITGELEGVAVELRLEPVLHLEEVHGLTVPEERRALVGHESLEYGVTLPHLVRQALHVLLLQLLGLEALPREICAHLSDLPGLPGRGAGRGVELFFGSFSLTWSKTPLASSCSSLASFWTATISKILAASWTKWPGALNVLALSQTSCTSAAHSARLPYGAGQSSCARCPSPWES